MHHIGIQKHIFRKLDNIFKNKIGEDADEDMELIPVHPLLTEAGWDTYLREGPFKL